MSTIRRTRYTLPRDSRVASGRKGLNIPGFIPAFLHRRSGEIRLSLFTNGRVAHIHVLSGLPENWVAGRDHEGRANTLAHGVVAGFARNGRFYTREEVPYGGYAQRHRGSDRD